MTRRIAISLAAAASLARAQRVQTTRPNWRTAPLGYTDTPVIPGQRWRVHDLARPQPPVVAPAAKPGDAPADAVVLFNGGDLSKWVQAGRDADQGKLVPARWRVEHGYVECVGRTGDLISKEKFGDAQFHIEWSAPPVIDGDSQWRGNSGVLLMGRYEIQVLDSWNNPTYADGQAGSIYGQWPPLVNPCRPPGEWNAYDIFWEAPRFDGSRLVKPAFVSVLFNGVLVHHHQELIGPMAHKVVRAYEPHGAEEPLVLQDHDTKARYRNIWARRLKPYDAR